MYLRIRVRAKQITALTWRLRESWPFRHIEKKGDFFRLIWAEIFLHKSLTDSGISHKFLRLFSFYTIENLHICGIFLHRVEEGSVTHFIQNSYYI